MKHLGSIVVTRKGFYFLHKIRVDDEGFVVAGSVSKYQRMYGSTINTATLTGSSACVVSVKWEADGSTYPDALGRIKWRDAK